MNSKQINFFLSQADFPSVYQFFITQQAILLEKTIKTSIPKNHALEKLSESSTQLIVTTKSNLPLIQLTDINDGLYMIDVTDSYCIELTLGGFYPYSDRVLNRGRLYFVKKYYDGEIEKIKDDVFVVWADEMLKKFTEYILIKSDLKGIFMSKNANDWMRENNATLDPTEQKLIAHTV